MYREIDNLSLDGEVLDLGGSTGSDYHALIKGKHNITTVNIDEEHLHDLSFNLEEVFPIEDGKYNTVLAINVMEHLFNYEQFLKEIYRVLQVNGTAIIAVPFLVQVHPSPKDYFRFTGDALDRLINNAGFNNVSIKPIGRGPFTAANQIVYNSLKFGLVRGLCGLITTFLDATLSLFDRKKSFGASRYPLGYFVVAKK